MTTYDNDNYCNLPIFGDAKIGNALRIEVPLRNTSVWYRRPNGAYPFNREPLDWLAEHNCDYALRRASPRLKDVISGTFDINYYYGDIRLGPDPHLYSEPDFIHGPVTGYFWFHRDQSDLAILFRLAF